jgi:hypothetical protein
MAHSKLYNPITTIYPIRLQKSPLREHPSFKNTPGRTECKCDMPSLANNTVAHINSEAFSVNIDTLRGQLLYEIQGPYYFNPDVIADLTNITIQQAEKDRVHVCGVKGRF